MMGLVFSADTVGPRPLVALFVQGAFEVGPVLAGDAPLFVLYDDGTVIYCVQRTSGLGGKQVLDFAVVRLSPSEFTVLRDSLAVSERLFPLRDSYSNAPNVTDMPHYVIWAWQDGIAKRVSLYGSTDTTAWVVQRSARESTDTVPKAFLELYRLLCDFRHPRASPWRVAAYELVLQDFGYAREPGMPWPRGWSAPGRADSLGFRYTPITARQFETFRDEYAPQIHTQPFILDGAKWFAVARIVFPGEEWWSRHGNGPPN
jgi:hypothetical protein